MIAAPSTGACAFASSIIALVVIIVLIGNCIPTVAEGLTNYEHAKNVDPELYDKGGYGNIATAFKAVSLPYATDWRSIPLH